MLKFFAFDTETTGLDPKQDRIIQLCVRVYQQHETLGLECVAGGIQYLDPSPKEINPDAAKVHGLTIEELRARGAMPFTAADAQALNELLRLCSNTVMAYNARFDLQFLSMEMERVGVAMGNGEPIVVFDPLTVYREDSPRRLEDACRFYGVEFDPTSAHDAAYDVDAMARVVMAQRECSANVDKGTSIVVDSAGYFVRDEEGGIRYGFGKHNGKRVVDVERSYLVWMIGSDFPLSTKVVAKRCLSDIDTANHSVALARGRM